MTDERYEQFEAYLRGTLDESQRKKVHEALQNPEVQAEFNAYRKLRRTIGQRWQRQASTQAFTAHLHQVASQHGSASTATGKRRSLRRIVLIAACALLAIAASFVRVRQQQFSDQGLITQYIQESQQGLVRGAEGLNRYHKALMAYQNEQWAAAAEAFAQVPQEDASFLDAQLFAGYAYLQDQAYPEARAAFRKVISEASGRLQQNAEWHLALAELPDTDQEQLPPALQGILSNQKHAFHVQAGALAADLASVWR